MTPNLFILTFSAIVAGVFCVAAILVMIVRGIKRHLPGMRPAERAMNEAENLKHRED